MFLACDAIDRTERKIGLRADDKNRFPEALDEEVYAIPVPFELHADRHHTCFAFVSFPAGPGANPHSDPHRCQPAVSRAQTSSL